MSIPQPSGQLQPPPIDKTTKPKRSVSFMNHTVLSSDDSASTPGSSRLGRSSFQPGRRKGYVRKGPVNSDSESDDDDEDDNTKDCSDQEDKDQMSPESGLLGLTLGQTPMRPGQNYVRKAPVNSDTESDDESEERLPLPSARQLDFSDIKEGKGAENDSDSEHNDKDIGALASPFSHTRISGPGQNYVRKAPIDSDAESDEEQLDGESKAMAIPKSKPESQPGLHNGQKHGPDSGISSNETSFLNIPTPATLSSTDLASSGASMDGRLSPAVRNISPAQPVTGSPYNNVCASSIGMSMGNSSNSSVNNSAAANIVNSMAIYQQQQQEMMMIMQQQQIQIATMQQQQQAYQLLMLQQQQQQQHQQQIQAVQLNHSRASSLNDSVHTPNEDGDDDDVPLGEKKQQLSQAPHLPPLMGSYPGTPPPQLQPILGTASTLQLSPSVQPSILSMPLVVSHPYSPLQYNQHSRQTSGSSFHSVNSVASSPHQIMQQSHLQSMVSSPLNPASFSPLVQQSHQPQYSHPQPRLAEFIEEEQERMRQEQVQQDHLGAVGGAQLLTSSFNFPAGYHASIGPMSLGQLNHDHGSANPTGPSGSSIGGTGAKGGASRFSVMSHQQVLQPPSSPLVTFHQPQVQQPLIHVESKPPPPQTGLVGAISAMEREKRLAKANGTNQLQFQHQQQQQQIMINADKERWLQEQRRHAWESEQMQLYQQQSQFVLPTIPTTPLWTVEDEEDDNRPLGGAH
ncbi:hypothetical protein BGX21_009865 [Mortierella sp. AD011]|nr:hypothetical protein BGX20_009948 [Mortierella sp. AD010]KAF9395534.1 hypothetical protein BGX21_009865 [Mortierella sp. AD011]